MSESESKSWKLSEVLIRISGTCVVLAAVFGIAGCVVQEQKIAVVALAFLAGAGLSFVAFIIASIWDE